jgi:lysophospholipase
MPILVADSRAPGEILISLNTTNFEFNPFETGSFDPTMYGFVPTKYLGSNFTNGQIPQDQRYVRGFDNLGFVMGTSSSLFNQVLLNLKDLGLPSFLNSLISGFLERVGRENNDIADYTPNPFRGFNQQQTETLTTPT